MPYEMLVPVSAAARVEGPDTHGEALVRVACCHVVVGSCVVGTSVYFESDASNLMNLSKKAASAQYETHP